MPCRSLGKTHTSLANISIIHGAYENASTGKSSTGGGASTEKASTNVQRWKMQVRKNEVEMLLQASADGATIDGSRCETDITKHSNKHMTQT